MSWLLKRLTYVGKRPSGRGPARAVVTSGSIKAGHIYGVPPEGLFEYLLCSLDDASTIHWGMFVEPAGTGDWLVTTSGPKGIRIGPLGSLYTARSVKIYRIRPEGGFDPESVDADQLKSLVKICRSARGVAGALKEIFGVIRAILWYLRWFNYRVGRPADPNSNNPDCQAWVIQLAKAIANVELIPSGQYPVSINLEYSPSLEYLGELDLKSATLFPPVSRSLASILRGFAALLFLVLESEFAGIGLVVIALLVLLPLAVMGALEAVVALAAGRKGMKKDEESLVDA